jgi:hypothetical protein
VLVDGGLRNNYPTDIAREMGADIIIGVTVQGAPKTSDELGHTISILSQIIDVNCKNKYDENLAITDIPIRVDTEGYNAASFNDNAINGMREDIAYNINIRNYLLPIFLTSVLMNENLLGKKDETGFSDFKYFHDYQKHKFNITEDMSFMIQKMFAFVTKTIDTYIKILSKNCEKILKKYELYDALNEQNIIDFKSQYFMLKCTYNVPNEVMDNIIYRRLFEELSVPTPVHTQIQIESNLEMMINREINKVK